jgi:ABC-type uncharacterized transport system permease subunit
MQRMSVRFRPSASATAWSKRAVALCERRISSINASNAIRWHLSAALMQTSLLPGWIRTVAKFNPVNWAVEAGRSAAMEQIHWGLVASRIGLLVALLIVSATLATRAFTKYQRSL